MKRINPFLIVMCLVGLVLAGRTARADVWESKGWVKLGERAVNGKYDHDTIEVGKYEGQFTKLTLVVEKSDIELLGFEVKFGNDEKWAPEVHHLFKEGQRTRVIDLPGDKRVIKTINLRYKNLPGGGSARVEVWGWKTADSDAGASKDAPWDSKGWTMLGERVVNGHGKEDHDRIEVGRREGVFYKITVVVLDSDLELTDLAVKFGTGEPWHPSVNHTFKEGQRTHVIDFPGNDREVKYIDFTYRNLPGGGKAKVQVWALGKKEH